MVRELSVELLERAKEELHEVPGRREADVQHLRDWLAKQPHIKAKPDTQTLLAFLRGCKFSLEKAKTKIDMYYTMRTALPDVFSKRDPRDKITREILKLGVFLPLPNVDDAGRRVFLIRPGAAEAGKYKMEEMFKINFMAFELLMREDDELIVNGAVTLLDFRNTNLGHVTQMNPSLIKKVTVCSEEAFPVRPKAINYIYMPTMMNSIFNLFKSFAKEKIQRRLHVHGDDLQALYKNIPQRLLPSEYGGDAGPIQEIADAWIARMDSYRDWFKKEQEFGVDETKRPGKPKTQQDLFGLEGSFRQLTVD